MTRISYLNLTEYDMKDELAARYQDYSLAQLLEVLENKAEYTSLAIEVAESEWDNRQITQEEFNTAKEELEQKKLQIFGGMLYYINTAPIKEMFSLNRWLRIVSIVPTTLFVTVQWLPLFF